jgi:hypothetical protein
MVWSEEAAKVHGITRTALRQLGVPAEQALSWFIADAKECDLIVAHNLEFDKKILWAATVRHGMAELPTWWPRSELCSMLATTPICQIPAVPTEKCPKPKDPYKWPRLNQVWSWLWPDRPLPMGLHDAGVDVTCLSTCFRELIRRELLVLPLVTRDDCRRGRDRFTVFLRDAVAAFATT